MQTLKSFSQDLHKIVWHLSYGIKDIIANRRLKIRPLSISCYERGDQQHNLCCKRHSFLLSQLRAWSILLKLIPAMLVTPYVKYNSWYTVQYICLKHRSVSCPDLRNTVCPPGGNGELQENLQQNAEDWYCQTTPFGYYAVLQLTLFSSHLLYWWPYFSSRYKIITLVLLLLYFVSEVKLTWTNFTLKALFCDEMQWLYKCSCAIFPKMH